MCGIAGYINLQGKPLESSRAVREMLKVQLHRGPDNQGIRVNIGPLRFSGQFKGDTLNSAIENGFGSIRFIFCQSTILPETCHDNSFRIIARGNHRPGEERGIARG